MSRQEVVEKYNQFLREQRKLDWDELATALEMVVANCALCVFHSEDSVFCGAHHDRTVKENPQAKCEDFENQPGKGISIEDAADYLHRRMRKLR